MLHSTDQHGWSKRLFILLLAASLNIVQSRDTRPNIVFLVVESTDGRTWNRNYMDGAVDLPNIRSLQDQGVEFQSHYANSPVCCPSRASFWSGRYPHKIPHEQAFSGLPVKGAWNNYEGLPLNFTGRIDQFLGRKGYNVKMAGKTDWMTGSHTLADRLAAWTKYANFPVNLSAWPGGWATESTCIDPGTIYPSVTPDPMESPWVQDWTTIQNVEAWIKKASTDPRPFFLHQSMHIVHPPYRTTQYWYDKVNRSKLVAPLWRPLAELHPCDFQASMLKGCIPPTDGPNASVFYTDAHKIRIRAIYLAMIAEFDAMVGAYIDAVKAIGRFNNTVFIVTADHGDMQMEHQQFYKMAAYDASARIPMVIMDGRHPLTAPAIVKAPTQLIDIYPTVLTYAEVPPEKWPALDGSPLQPLLGDKASLPHQMHSDMATAVPSSEQVALSLAAQNDAAAFSVRPDFVVSQFHGCDAAMSWFLVVSGDMKLIVWGTGEQNHHQLFNLTADPDEMHNLVDRPGMKTSVRTLLEKLGSVVNYTAVAEDVARYHHNSFAAWMKTEPDWKRALLDQDLRWHTSFMQNPQAAIAAIEEWFSRPAGEVKPCVEPPQG